MLVMGIIIYILSLSMNKEERNITIYKKLSVILILVLIIINASVEAEVSLLGGLLKINKDSKNLENLIYISSLMILIISINKKK